MLLVFYLLRADLSIPTAQFFSIRRSFSETVQTGDRRMAAFVKKADCAKAIEKGRREAPRKEAPPSGFLEAAQ